MKHLHPTSCEFMFFKDYKIDLGFLFIRSIINFKIQDLTYSLVYHHVIFHHYIFMRTIPSQLLRTIFSITFGFQSLFKNSIHIELFAPKMISLHLTMVSLPRWLFEELPWTLNFDGYI